MSGISFAQDTSDNEPSTPWLRVNGSMLLSAEYYTMTASVDSNGTPVWQPRRPANLYRLALSPVFTFFDKVVIPLQLIVSSRETNTITPRSLAPSLVEIFTNPLNTIGLTVSPGTDWLEFSLGAHTPRYSELSGSEIQMFGGGFKMNPGIFRMGFNMGISQRAIKPDSTNGIAGAYQKITTMAKIGLGTDKDGYFDINFVKVKDDTSSFAGKQKPTMTGLIRTEIGTDTNGFAIYNETIGNVAQLAQEGLLVSMAGLIPISEQVSMRLEWAACAFTRDLTAKPFENSDINVPEWLMTVNSSSHADYAMLSALNCNFDNWGVELKGKFVGAGFVWLGYPFAQSDYLDLTIAPRLALLDNDITFNGIIGTRFNNISRSATDVSTQLLLAANLNLVLSQNFSLALSFSNFGFRNNVANDSLRIQNVSRSYSITPTYTIFGLSSTQTISLTAGLDTYQDYNLISGRLSDNNTFSLFGLYSVSFIPTPITLTLTGNYLKNDLADIGFTVLGGGGDISYRMFGDVLTPTAGISYNLNTPGSFTADTQILYRLGLRLRITNGLTLSSNAMINDYHYGSSRPNMHFTEEFAQLSLAVSF